MPHDNARKWFAEPFGMRLDDRLPAWVTAPTAERPIVPPGRRRTPLLTPLAEWRAPGPVRPQ